MENSSPIKEILYNEIKKIPKKEIQKLQNEDYFRLITSLFENTESKISNIKGKTNEKLGTGSSYPDIDVDGVKYGIGFKTGTAGGILFKIEGTYTEFDAISVNSTGSDTATTITSPGTEIGAVKLAVGYAF